MAARVGIGKDAVARIWADHDLKPQETKVAVNSRDGSDSPILQRALLRGDVREIRNLVDAELAELRGASPRARAAVGGAVIRKHPWF